MIFTDRSRLETGFQCPRRRYHNYTNGGRGYVPAAESQDLWFGKWIHASIEALACNKTAGVDAFPFTAEDVTADGLPVEEEWNALQVGLMHTFDRFTLPQLLEEYEWVSSEQELNTLLAPDVTLMSRLDGVFRRKSDGVYFVLEAKTSSWPSRLIDTSRTNFQLLLECEALHRSLPEGSEVGGAILLVFDKGQRKRDYKGEGYRRLSPFTYCYSKERANGTTEYALEYKSGWQRTPTWTIPNWYDLLVEWWPEVVKGQVMVVPSIDFDAERVRSVITQVVAQERRLTSVAEVDAVWPQNFAACADQYSKRCTYFDMCYSPRIAGDPVGSGQYVQRTPNHPQEVTDEKTR